MCTHARTHSCTHALMLARIHARTHACTYTYVHTYKRTRSVSLMASEIRCEVRVCAKATVFDKQDGVHHGVMRILGMDTICVIVLYSSESFSSETDDSEPSTADDIEDQEARSNGAAQESEDPSVVMRPETRQHPAPGAPVATHAYGARHALNFGHKKESRRRPAHGFSPSAPENGNDANF
ncbi:hypothetical protein EVAR_54953_1 [Eumeta japonica]|uniref:Uncharacterized protein n=1 Tax=Eumeta variegata TaxID=151549 RepID=A0A4C1YJ34_EUMVA|nr:hypothetical protein EVAR_54953_1 [Eumeta japonica]